MNRKALFLVSLAFALVAVPDGARAADEITPGQFLAPGFDTLGGLLGASRDAFPEAAPLVDVVSVVVRYVRDLTYTIVLGLSDGDAGTDPGTPDRVGARAPAVTVVNGASIPALGVGAPPQPVEIGTPPVSREIRTPPVAIPRIEVHSPGFGIPVGVPGISTPPVSVHVGPREVATPPVGTPPVRVDVPPLVVPANSLTIDHGSLRLRTEGARGTVYAGPVQVPYEIPSTNVGPADALPPEVPRKVTVDQGQVLDQPGRRLVDEPARILVPSQRASTPPVDVEVPGLKVADPVTVGSLQVSPAGVTIPEWTAVPEQRVRADVPGTRVGSVTVPGAGIRTEEVALVEDEVATPGIGVVQETPLPVDDLGYFGYGKERDSSLYPYACGPLVGCLRTEHLLRGYVDYADRSLDALAALVDEGIVVTVPDPPRPGPGPR